MRLLIVEDDEMLRDGLLVGLRLQGFSTEAVETLSDARQAIALPGFEAMVLDLMLPDGSGLDLLRELRSQGSALPVLVLTARDQTAAKIAGLDAGADDYLAKPFDLGEVAARLRALIRRAQGRSQPELRWNGLVLDPARMSGHYAGRPVHFPPREFMILQALMEMPGAILSKSQLEERLYGWQEEVESNTIEVHVHKLRARLTPEFIRTIRGAGYKLAEPA